MRRGSWYALGIGLALVHSSSAGATREEHQKHLDQPSPEQHPHHHRHFAARARHERAIAQGEAKTIHSIRSELGDLRRQVASMETLRRQAGSVDSLQKEINDLKARIWGPSALALATIPLKPQLISALEPTAVRLNLPDLSTPRRDAPELPSNPKTASLPAVIEERAIQQLQPKSAVEEAKTYLIATATPGYTMVRQGVDVAIGRLHPDFAVKLANAIRLARASGLTDAGVFSAYRPPAFGVGGFSDKFNSLHSYGLAADITGIGSAGSKSARLWQSIVQQVGLYLPYGSNNRAEFNHTQLVPTKVAPEFLRKTITAGEPKDLQRMWLASGIKDFVNAVVRPLVPALEASGADPDHGTLPTQEDVTAPEKAPSRKRAPKAAASRHKRGRSRRGRAPKAAATPHKSPRSTREGARPSTRAARQKSSTRSMRRKGTATKSSARKRAGSGGRRGRKQ